MKVLNLYAGIGGNRKLWKDVEVTAVEINPEIAAIYSDFFPNDKIIVADAHEYLLKHYKEFDFIWSSPPCQSHSQQRLVCVYTGKNEAVYPNMSLYQEIIFLDKYFKGKWVVENVIPFYVPLIRPSRKIQRHLFWSNFIISDLKDIKADNIADGNQKEWSINNGFDISDYKISHRKDQILRNCVNPKIGLHVFESAFKKVQLTILEGEKE